MRGQKTENSAHNTTTKRPSKQVVRHFLPIFFFQDVQTLYLSQDIETHSCINWKQQLGQSKQKGLFVVKIREKEVLFFHRDH